MIEVDGIELQAEDIRVIHILDNVWVKSDKDPNNQHRILTSIAYVVKNDDSCYEISPSGVDTVSEFANNNSIKVTYGQFPQG